MLGGVCGLTGGWVGVRVNVASKNILWQHRLSGFEFRGRAGLLLQQRGWGWRWVRQNLIFWEKILKDSSKVLDEKAIPQMGCSLRVTTLHIRLMLPLCSPINSRQ